jgi:hypothetical protein
MRPSAASGRPVAAILRPARPKSTEVRTVIKHAPSTCASTVQHPIVKRRDTPSVVAWNERKTTAMFLFSASPDDVTLEALVAGTADNL